GDPVTTGPEFSCPPARSELSASSDFFVSAGTKSPIWRNGGPFAEGQVVIESCIDCHAWGVTRTLQWLCYGCKSWRENHRRTGQCPSCGQEAALHTVTGSCRLCHKQRSWYAKHTGRRPNTIAFTEANRGGQQLFVANTFYVHHGRGQLEYRKKTMPVDMSVLRPVAWQQLTLFDSPRDFKAGLERGFLPPPRPDVAAAFNIHVNEHANRYGWTVSKTERVKRGIRILLGLQDTPGARIRRSDVALLSRIKHSAQVVAHVLETAGMLDNDREPAVVRWFHATIAELPQQMRTELTVWFDVMRNGSTSPPRQRPRQDTTISTKLRWAMPALRAWASEHESLCAIGRDNVHAAIAGKNALARSTMLSGLRSIFTILKGRKMVFVNPTTRIKVDEPGGSIPPPVDLARLKELLNSDDPVKAALSALLAFHAVRIWQLRSMKLTDYHDGRLYLGDQVILLAPPVRQRLDAYLRHRQATWPTSTNPHMFIHLRNWSHHGQVWPAWIAIQLGMSPQVIRRDRILDEAHATSGDIKQLVELFGLSIDGAAPYVNAVSHAAAEEA
ncbi:hypothetical protein, partial [Phytohabitans aurantiacus]|uniref:hypothetical protein n=1 Tax=Phytohabitans aurantiacus TaxID=3016789 RepID=UPI002852C16E